MKLKSISITNFRQFWKTVHLEFSCNENKNITVIHGANGAGKTSLLNAFKWCFYGKTDFDTNTENILNETAIQTAPSGQALETRVTVIFEEQGENYEATRTAQYRKLSGMEVENLNLSKLSIFKTSEDGQSHEVEAPESEINRILPESLQPYFFFNGERIEKLAGVNESSQIKEAIKRLMGLKQIERAQRHLKKVTTKFRGETAKNQDSDSQKLVQEIEILENQLDEKSNLLETEKSQLKETQSNFDAVEKRLDNYKEVKHLQEKRKQLNDKNDEYDADIAENIKKRKALLDKSRAILLSETLVNKCEQLVEENRKKGVLPYKIRAPFIEDLLENEICICGKHIDEDSKKKLTEAMDNAGNDNLDSVFNSVSFFIKNFKSQSQEYKKSLLDLIEDNSELKSKKKKIALDISEISVQLKLSESNDIAELEQRREELLEKLVTHRTNIKQIEIELPNIELDLSSKKRKWEKHQSKLDKHNLALERQQAAENVILALEQLNQFFTEKVRSDLSKRVDTTFNSIIRKNMKAYIDDDYRLKVEKGGIEGNFEAQEQSTGEKQVTSLSFISSIISLAKERHSNEKNKMFKGGLYPLVMDSPFGALDDDYRFKVAGKIAELADQVIIFVSNSQWNGNVKSACESNVGSCFKLVHYSNSEAAKNAEHSEFLKYAEGTGEYSEIEEVELA